MLNHYYIFVTSDWKDVRPRYQGGARADRPAADPPDDGRADRRQAVLEGRLVQVLLAEPVSAEHNVTTSCI